MIFGEFVMDDSAFGGFLSFFRVISSLCFLNVVY